MHASGVTFDFNPCNNKIMYFIWLSTVPHFTCAIDTTTLPHTQCGVHTATQPSKTLDGHLADDAHA